MFSKSDTQFIKGVLWVCIFGVFVCGVGIGWAVL